MKRCGVLCIYILNDSCHVWRVNDRSTKTGSKETQQHASLVVQVRGDSGMKHILSRTDFFDGLDGTQ